MSEEEKIEDIKQEETPTEVETEEEFKDKYFRLLAEMENSRKRMQKEKHEMTRFAIENVIAEILLPIDTLESALSFTDQMSQDTRNWAKGFEMILNQFKEILHTHNIVAFHSKGEMFNPHKHEAVEMEETEDHPEGTILKEFLKGYKSGDRILRAARVKVAKAPKNELKENKE
ncbi:MAG TPA: nucleotide exchange factor GrpE [Rhabdochlamydiaceae bacterium]|nr:nucleotide exchange factor GrpE [Rhabdochlamydiaceae bacterium]